MTWPGCSRRLVSNGQQPRPGPFRARTRVLSSCFPRSRGRSPWLSNDPSKHPLSIGIFVRDSHGRVEMHSRPQEFTLETLRQRQPSAAVSEPSAQKPELVTSPAAQPKETQPPEVRPPKPPSETRFVTPCRRHPRRPIRPSRSSGSGRSVLRASQHPVLLSLSATSRGFSHPLPSDPQPTPGSWCCWESRAWVRASCSNALRIF